MFDLDLFFRWCNPLSLGCDSIPSPHLKIGQLIEFVNPWLGLSPWGVYTGEGYVIHFGVGGKKLSILNNVTFYLNYENMPQQAGRSFLQLMIRVPAGTRISVNNKHNLTASPLETIWRRCETFLHQEFKYDLVNFNSEHFATFVQYGHAVNKMSGVTLAVSKSSEQTTAETF
uniref:LRAT domain-containing protein n=1 Tax=Xiphophorus maculatus TaxID=8083 RepID=A0A3B5RFN0_XIPMA